MFKYFKYSRRVLAPPLFVLIYLLFSHMPPGPGLILFAIPLIVLVYFLLWPNLVANELLAWFYDDLQARVDPEDDAVRYYFGTAHAWANTPQSLAILTGVNLPPFLKEEGVGEFIIASAVRHPSGLIFGVMRPGRHHHCFRGMSKLFDAAGLVNTRDQGFITSLGRYVNRSEGAVIARAACQLVRMPTPDDNLTSEDVWQESILPPGIPMPMHVPAHLLHLPYDATEEQKKEQWQKTINGSQELVELIRYINADKKR